MPSIQSGPSLGHADLDVVSFTPLALAR